MKPYILQVAHLDKVSEGQYVAHIAILDSNNHCFTGIPYKTIVVDAINEEFARKIADIRIEEMMLTNASEIDSIYDKNILIDITKNYSKMYANIVVEMEKLRKQQENLLTALVKEAQQSAEEGLDIEDMGIEVELDGYEGHLVYAIRTVSDEGSDDHLELKLLSVVPDEHEKFLGVYEYEWLSIYDFHSWAAETILSEIMENL
jgi:hypothetical protein